MDFGIHGNGVCVRGRGKVLEPIPCGHQEKTAQVYRKINPHLPCVYNPAVQ